MKLREERRAWEIRNAKFQEEVESAFVNGALVGSSMTMFAFIVVIFGWS